MVKSEQYRTYREFPSKYWSITTLFLMPDKKNGNDSLAGLVAMMTTLHSSIESNFAPFERSSIFRACNSVVLFVRNMIIRQRQYCRHHYLAPGNFHSRRRSIPMQHIHLVRMNSNIYLQLNFERHRMTFGKIFSRFVDERFTRIDFNLLIDCVKSK